MAGALRRFPNSAISIALGLGGQSILWKNLSAWKLTKGCSIFAALNRTFWCGAISSLSIFCSLYAAKSVWHPDVVLKEWRHRVRSNFFGAIAIALCMLGIGAPPQLMDLTFTRGLWVFTLCYQLVMAIVLYHRLIYSYAASEPPVAQDLLAVMPWLLLSVLGLQAGVDGWLGLPAAAMCLGVGAFWAVFDYPFILAGVAAGRTAAGSPALFLMLAPPPVAATAIARLSGGFGPFCSGILGATLFLLLFLLLASPRILPRPETMGFYWAYVFPPAALATFAVLLAEAHETPAMNGLAVALCALAVLSVALVLLRMSFQIVLVCRGADQWSDPLVDTEGDSCSDGSSS